jgi:hypothetical protein
VLLGAAASSALAHRRTVFGRHRGRGAYGVGNFSSAVAQGAGQTVTVKGDNIHKP